MTKRQENGQDGNEKTNGKKAKKTHSCSGWRKIRACFLWAKIDKAKNLFSKYPRGFYAYAFAPASRKPRLCPSEVGNYQAVPAHLVPNGCIKITFFFRTNLVIPKETCTFVKVQVAADQGLYTILPSWYDVNLGYTLYITEIYDGLLSSLPAQATRRHT